MVSLLGPGNVDGCDYLLIVSILLLNIYVDKSYFMAFFDV